MSKEKAKAAATVKKKVTASKKARVSAEKRSSELKAKLGEVELKLAKAASLNKAQAKEMADLKAVLKAYENKWYNEGFANAENSIGPVINEARKLAFGEGWLAPCKLWGSPRNQIPFPGPLTAIQNQPDVIDETETTSMRELVEAIDSHAKPIDLEATNNPNVEDQLGRNV